MGANDHSNGTRKSGRGGNFQKGSRNPFTKNEKPSTWYLSSKDAEKVFDAIGVCISNGCLISFSRTQDGGALCITIMDGSDRYRTYCTSNREIDDALSGILQMYSPKEGGMPEVDLPKALLDIK